jgi:prepilin-type N-terminal cleavage/methylation domain-containing protein
MSRLADRDSAIRASGTSGFTLIEVLVALSVLSIGIVPLFVALRGSVNQVSAAERQHRATLLLQTLLETAAVNAPPVGTLEGRSPEGLYEWRVTTRVWERAGLEGLTAQSETNPAPQAIAAAPGATVSSTLLEVIVSVTWHEPGRRRSLDATRLVPEKASTNGRSLGEDLMHSVLTGNPGGTSSDVVMHE